MERSFSSVITCEGVAQGASQRCGRIQFRSCLGRTSGRRISREGKNSCLFEHWCWNSRLQISTRLVRESGGCVGIRRQLPEITTASDVFSRLLEPVVFDASKLSVDLTDSKSPADVAYPSQLLPRRYTLTHHDVTAELRLSVGSSFNTKQLGGWYTRLLRDEITAEWRSHGEDKKKLSLHVHCHVSGGHPFLAPAGLRNWIFQREMPLVLQALRHGDEALLTLHPELDLATVWVHYHSSHSEYDRASCWGPLCLAAANLHSSLGDFAPAHPTVLLPQLAVQAWHRDEARLETVEPFTYL